MALNYVGQTIGPNRMVCFKTTNEEQYIHNVSNKKKPNLFTDKTQHELPYHTFIHKVRKSYTKPRTLENMGFYMKYDILKLS